MVKKISRWNHSLQLQTQHVKTDGRTINPCFTPLGENSNARGSGQHSDEKCSHPAAYLIGTQVSKRDTFQAIVNLGRILARLQYLLVCTQPSPLPPLRLDGDHMEWQQQHIAPQVSFKERARSLTTAFLSHHSRDGTFCYP